MKQIKRTTQRLPLALLAALPILWAGATAGAWAQDGAGAPLGVAWSARVSHVVDGDSIWVRPEGGGGRVKLRLAEVDAPELCQDFGPQARAALRALLPLGQRVRVTVRDRDRYGRAIAHVVREPDAPDPSHAAVDNAAAETTGLDVAAQMVAQGLAWTDHYHGQSGLYGRAERDARAAGRGLFGQPGAQTPADFRRQHGPCEPRAGTAPGAKTLESGANRPI